MSLLGRTFLKKSLASFFYYFFFAHHEQLAKRWHVLLPADPNKRLLNAGIVLYGRHGGGGCTRRRFLRECRGVARRADF